MIENHIDAPYAIDLYDVRTREHSARRLRRSQGHQLKQIFLSSRSSDSRCAQVYTYIYAHGRKTEERGNMFNYLEYDGGERH